MDTVNPAPTPPHLPVPAPVRDILRTGNRLSACLLLGGLLNLGFLPRDAVQASDPAQAPMRVVHPPGSGSWDLFEGEQPILRYNYQTLEPGELLAQVSEPNRKYARARSDYIHPLYGPQGEIMTQDWALDHPHHRGIYWAWPEVDFGLERGDLHALQFVFARPTGRCEGHVDADHAWIQAENLWKWEDREAIVREQVLIRAWRSRAGGRWIDLEFRFTALQPDVTLARRETRLYGGLNTRLAPVQEQRIAFHTDPPEVIPRRAWADLSGRFGGGTEPIGLAILQHPANPDYPGDWVEYPELNWFQPTFPQAETRFPLAQDRPLVLRYRLWVHPGRKDAPALAAAWGDYTENAAPSKP